MVSLPKSTRSIYCGQYLGSIQTKHVFITACQRSCEKVMFSVLSACLSTGRWVPCDHFAPSRPVQTCSLGKAGSWPSTERPSFCKSYAIYTYRCTLQKMLSRFVLPYRCKVGKIKATLEAYVKEKHFESVFQVNRKIKLLL